MTKISDERLAEIDELVSKLNHLVSLDRPENGGPYQGLAARECLSAMQQAADAIQSLRAQGGVTIDVDALAQEIRRLDGDNSLGAGQLAEALMPFLSSLEASPAPVSEETVEAAHKAQMSELFLRCQPDKGGVFAFMDDRKDVMRIALTAALAAKGGQ